MRVIFPVHMKTKMALVFFCMYLASAPVVYGVFLFLSLSRIFYIELFLA